MSVKDVTKGFCTLTNPLIACSRGVNSMRNESLKNKAIAGICPLIPTLKGYKIGFDEFTHGIHS
jgi:hypothetical protein